MAEQPTLDMNRPVLRRKGVKARNEARIRTDIDAGESGGFTIDEAPPAGTGQGPSPLQAVLGAVCACLAITLRRVADEAGFVYAAVDLSAEFEIDIRGRLGMAGVLPYFGSATLVAVVSTAAPDETLAEMGRRTLARSPVFNLLRDTRAKVQVTWQRQVPA